MTQLHSSALYRSPLSSPESTVNHCRLSVSWVTFNSEFSASSWRSFQALVWTSREWLFVFVFLGLFSLFENLLHVLYLVLNMLSPTCRIIVHCTQLQRRDWFSLTFQVVKLRVKKQISPMIILNCTNNNYHIAEFKLDCIVYNNTYLSFGPVFLNSLGLSVKRYLWKLKCYSKWNVLWPKLNIEVKTELPFTPGLERDSLLPSITYKTHFLY